MRISDWSSDVCSSDLVVAITATRGLDASTTGNGDGGSIELVGANGARIFGDLRARGGASGGDGGFIQTSGGGVHLLGIGSDHRHPQRHSGTWRLDPAEVPKVPRHASGTLSTQHLQPTHTT